MRTGFLEDISWELVHCPGTRETRGLGPRGNDEGGCSQVCTGRELFPGGRNESLREERQREADRVTPLLQAS